MDPKRTLSSSRNLSMSSRNLRDVEHVLDPWTETQDHIKRHYESLSEQPQLQGEFLNMLTSIDPTDLKKKFKASQQHQPSSNPPQPFKNVVRLDAGVRRTAQWQRGLRACAKGVAATLILAGGQGTRLGSSDPKGMYDVGLPSGRTLFHMLCDRVSRVRELAARAANVSIDTVHVPMLIMTSAATHAQTVAYFERSQFFGLPKEDVLFFEQAQAPCLSPNGKVLLTKRGQLAMAPTGNGDVYGALHRSGVLDELEKRGVQQVHQIAVDNALALPVDPVAVGVMEEHESELLVKIVKRRDASEKVGVFAQRGDGKGLGVLEYSEIPEELATAMDDKGELIFGMSHICINSMGVSFLRRVVEEKLQDDMPLHAAKKEIPSLDLDADSGPSEKRPGIKLEAFIFDVFWNAKNPVGLLVDRHREFAPLKRAPGGSSATPHHVRKAVATAHAERLRACGAPFEDDKGVVGELFSGERTIEGANVSNELGLVELSPLLSMCDDDVDDLLALIDEQRKAKKSTMFDMIPLQLEASSFKPGNILLTGGAGFIASHTAVHLVNEFPQSRVVVLDKLDYCSSRHNLDAVKDAPNFEFVMGDIRSTDLVTYLLKAHNIDTVMHLAAQTHVDNSFGNSIQFSENNILGTHVLLECAKRHGVRRFVHISTDEVYGEVPADETHARESERLLAPTNPYAATKAAAEYLVLAYYKSFGLPIIITRGNNVYGPHQFPEKLIPKFAILLSRGKEVPLHGDGSNVRNFIYVTDVARALSTVMKRGKVGEIYNIGTDFELTNLEVAHHLCKYFDIDPAKYVKKVADRPFNDLRYAIDSTKMHALGWQPLVPWGVGLARTVGFYTDNEAVTAHWEASIVSQVLCAHPRMGSNPHDPKA